MQGAPQICNYRRGVACLPHGAPKITAVVHLQSCTESSLLLLTLLRAGMERFLPSASGSSAAGLKPCGEPKCKFKSQLVTSVHQCPFGRSMHEFCGRGIGKKGHGQQRVHRLPEEYCCTCFLFFFLGVVHLFRYFLLLRFCVVSGAGGSVLSLLVHSV